MKIRTRQKGFTTVELLITLFVAGIFLVAGSQLYNVIIKDGGEIRSQNRAASVAYDYLRRYTATTVSPCVASTPLTNSSISVDALTDVTVSVAITCPYPATTTISRVEVTVHYNNPQQTVEYATLVQL